MVSIPTYKKIALSFQGSVEEAHFEKTSFRINKKIFTTLDAPKKRVCLKLTKTDQSVFCAYDKTIIYPVPNLWGKHGWVFIELSLVPKAMLQDALTCAYLTVSQKKKATIK